MALTMTLGQQVIQNYMQRMRGPLVMKAVQRWTGQPCGAYVMHAVSAATPPINLTQCPIHTHHITNTIKYGCSPTYVRTFSTRNFSSTSSITAATASASPFYTPAPILSPIRDFRDPTIRRCRHVLGVETSCDDTAMAILDENGRVRSHASASQWHLFDQFHGVQPRMAAQAHTNKMDEVFQEVLTRAGLTMDEIDGIAVTAGPGLAPCLKVGMSWSSELARRHSLPFIGVHHMQAHAMVASLDHPQLKYPFLALLISGGHTELWLVESLSKVTILSATVDDAIGEAFDKAARLIGITRAEGQSPGAALEQLAQHPIRHQYSFPALDPTNMEFSFSGLKAALQRKVFDMRFAQANQSTQSTTPTSISGPSTTPSSPTVSTPMTHLTNSDIQRLTREFKQGLFEDSPTPSLPPLPRQDQIDLAAAFQHALIEQLSSRTLLAIRFCQHQYPQLKISQLVLAGGVACNHTIRTSLQQLITPYDMKLLSPRPLHCMDNGIMIAHLGLKLFEQGHSDPYELSFHTRWPIGQTKNMTRIKTEEEIRLERSRSFSHASSMHRSRNYRSSTPTITSDPSPTSTPIDLIGEPMPSTERSAAVDRNKKKKPSRPKREYQP